MKKITEIFLDFLEIVFVGATVFILVYLFIGQLLEVSGDSMLPNLHNDEQIIAEKISTKFGPPEREEIIIFRHPTNNGRLLIKRVIGLPGDTVEISNGNVYLNNKLLEEPYLNEQNSTFGNSAIEENTLYEIPGNAYLLMGDNRTESSDSRSFGFVDQEYIVGRALLVYYPLDSIRLIKH